MKKYLYLFLTFIIFLSMGQYVYAEMLNTEDCFLYETNATVEIINDDNSVIDTYNTTVWSKYDTLDNIIYMDNEGNIIVPNEQSYEISWQKIYYKETITGEKLYPKDVENSLDDGFIECYTVYYTNDGKKAEPFHEYGINGNVKIKYRTIDIPQPTYNLYLDSELFCTDISGIEYTLPEGEDYVFTNEFGKQEIYEFDSWITWITGDDYIKYEAGDTFSIPDRNVYLIPEYKTNVTTYLLGFNENGGTGMAGDLSTFLREGSATIIPNWTFIHATDESLKFSHWTDGTANYNPGDTYIMPDHDVTMTAVWVKDSSDFTVTLDSQHTRQGDTVTLTVSIQDNPGMISGGLTMNYDSSKFTFQSASSGEILKNADIHAETVSKNTVSVEWNSSGQICKGDGDILTLKFKVNEDIPDGAYKFTVCSPVLYTLENTKLHADDTSGNLIVHDGIMGDVNKDGKTDETDLTLLKQYFAGWANAADSIVDRYAADINMDGEFTRSDLMILARCFAFWENYSLDILFRLPIIQ